MAVDYKTNTPGLELASKVAPVSPIALVYTQNAAVMSQQQLWYFAYGSNMDRSVMVRRGITPLESRCVRIESQVLVFDVFGMPYSEPAMAGIRRRPSHCHGPDVHGVAYLLSASDYELLKVSEGAGTGYRETMLLARPLGPRLQHGPSETRLLRVATLTARNPFEPPRLPSRRYMDLLIRGAENSDLPPAYIEYLRGLPAYQRPSLTWAHELLAIRAFHAFWVPVVTFVMRRVKARAAWSPRWSAAAVNVLFRTMWFYHDAIHRRIWRCDGGAD